MKFKCVNLFLILSIVMTGCSSEPKSFEILWADKSTESQESIDSAIERLSEAKVNFIIDEDGNVLIEKKSLKKAVACCT